MRIYRVYVYNLCTVVTTGWLYSVYNTYSFTWKLPVYYIINVKITYIIKNLICLIYIHQRFAFDRLELVPTEYCILV